MKTQAYRCAEGALLDQPIDYQYAQIAYTSSEGEAFVGAWAQARKDVLGSCPPAAVGVARTAPLAHAPGETAQFLLGLCQGEPAAAEMARLDAMLRNFEAKKRVYTAYGPGMSSIGQSDFRDLTLYLLFGEVLARRYTYTRRLPYLNALMKCLDILCAYRSSLSDPQATVLAALILDEQSFVRDLDAVSAAGSAAWS